MRFRNGPSTPSVYEWRCVHVFAFAWESAHRYCVGSAIFPVSMLGFWRISLYIPSQSSPGVNKGWSFALLGLGILIPLTFPSTFELVQPVSFSSLSLSSLLVVPALLESRWRSLHPPCRFMLLLYIKFCNEQMFSMCSLCNFCYHPLFSCKINIFSDADSSLSLSTC